MKTGGPLIKHARYYWLLLAESHLTRRLFGRDVGQNRSAAGAGGIGRSRNEAGSVTGEGEETGVWRIRLEVPSFGSFGEGRDRIGKSCLAEQASPVKKRLAVPFAKPCCLCESNSAFLNGNSGLSA